VGFPSGEGCRGVFFSPCFYAIANALVSRVLYSLPGA
jgi:hypothetical protein